MSELRPDMTYAEYLSRHRERDKRSAEMFTGEKSITLGEELERCRQQADIDAYQATMRMEANLEEMRKARDDWAQNYKDIEDGKSPNTVKVYAHRIPTTQQQCKEDMLLLQKTQALDREEYRCPRCRFICWVPILPPMEMLRVTSDGHNWKVT